MSRHKFIPQFEPLIKRKYAKAVEKQILSGWVGSSKTTTKFEHAIKKVMNVDYCISTTSGTASLMLAIESLHLPKGSTILFPNYTFLAGANAAPVLGYKIRLVDVNTATMGMDVDLIESHIDDSVSCIMYVNHNGYCGYEHFALHRLCEKYNLKLIQDSSQCFAMENFCL